MATQVPVLVAGATGLLGFEIAKQLSRQAGIQVNALIRPGTNPHKQDKLNVLRHHNVRLIPGDLLDPASLHHACQNIDTVISAVNGDATILIDGQTNLIQAAAANGVRRFIPSDYNIDYRKLNWGDHDHHDCRKAILTLLQGSGLSYTLILNGILMETLFSPFGIVFDCQQNQFQYWGDGHTNFDVTSLHDVAAYTAAAVLDPGLANQALEVAGDRLTLQELKADYEAQTIAPLTDRPLGTTIDLLHWLIQHRRHDRATYLAHQSHYALISGKGRLDHRHNDRYPHIRPINIQDYIRNHAQTPSLSRR